MCHASALRFGKTSLSRDEVEGKRIIDVGAYNVNGSFRTVLEKLNPKEYVGVDIEPGPGVDFVCEGDKLVEKFGKESFDLVISTELLEHVIDWIPVVSNIKNLCKCGGKILITTRSLGFPYHPFPFDVWRYEIEDMKNIFGDFEIEILEKDSQCPGVFMKARKPENFKEIDLKDYELFSIIADKRIKTFEKEKLSNVLSEGFGRLHPFVVKVKKDFRWKLIEKIDSVIKPIYHKIRGR